MLCYGLSILNAFHNKSNDQNTRTYFNENHRSNLAIISNFIEIDESLSHYDIFKERLFSLDIEINVRFPSPFKSMNVNSMDDVT